MSAVHEFAVTSLWTGNQGTGTSDYRAYARDHEIGGVGKSTTILGSSDPVFRGDGKRYNPEELLVASLSACHMLWYLHLCADAGIVVVEYTDAATGTMDTGAGRAGEFTHALLKPRVVITDAARIPDALALHDEAHGRCFIAQSVKFPVDHKPEIVAAA